MSLLTPVQAPRQHRSPLGEAGFRRLRDAIYRYSGIFLPDSKQYLLDSRVASRMAVLGWGDVSKYALAVENDASGELFELVEAVSVNETCFFRNAPQMDALEHHVLPQLIRERRRQGNGPIKLWSAGCSTGEEAFSLALLVRDRILPAFPGTEIQIIGSDISEKALEKARCGVYGDYALRQMPRYYLQRYFTSTREGFALAPEVRRMVTFKRVNLYDTMEMRSMRFADIVLCANVLIYFDAASKQRVLDGLYGAINAGGTLFMGFSESLNGVCHRFQAAHFEKTLAFVRA